MSLENTPKKNKKYKGELMNSDYFLPCHMQLNIEIEQMKSSKNGGMDSPPDSEDGIDGKYLVS